MLLSIYIYKTRKSILMYERAANFMFSYISVFYVPVYDM